MATIHPLSTLRNFIDAIYEQIEEIATRCLELGLDVVLDFGFWTRQERDAVRAKLAAVGGQACLYRLICPEDEAWRRIEKRNADLRGSLYIARNTFEILKGRFEPLGSDEEAIEITGSEPLSRQTPSESASPIASSMEPELETVGFLRLLEEQLLQPEIRRSAAKIGDLLAEEFVEFGSSGRAFDKSQIIERLRQECPAIRPQWSITDFSVRWLAPDTVLATYRLVVCHDSTDDEHHTLRSSIWKLIKDKWQMIFHQGTPTGPP